MSTTSGCKGIRISKTEFAEKAQFLVKKSVLIFSFQDLKLIFINVFIKS